MSYNGLTNQGLEYLTRCQVESKPVVFSKVKIGNGNIPMGSTGETTTDLYSFKKEIEILNKEQVENSIKIEILINNFDVLEEFYVKEIGVYVIDNDVEKLYWYINKDRPSPLPDKNTPAKHRYILHLETSQMESIILNYTGLDLMVDKEFVETRFNEAKGRIKAVQFPNIGSLKLKNLKVGDIVEVLGYYEAGDGAGHKRIIANKDDGSGVQLSNGLWANIVHNGEVNVSWFGAKGDGIIDDTIAFEKAFNLLNVNKIICSNGKVYYFDNIINARKKTKAFIFDGQNSVFKNFCVEIALKDDSYDWRNAYNSEIALFKNCIFGTGKYEELDKNPFRPNIISGIAVSLEYCTQSNRYVLLAYVKQYIDKLTVKHLVCTNNKELDKQFNSLSSTPIYEYDAIMTIKPDGNLILKKDMNLSGNYSTTPGDSWLFEQVNEVYSDLFDGEKKYGLVTINGNHNANFTSCIQIHVSMNKHTETNFYNCHFEADNTGCTLLSFGLYRLLKFDSCYFYANTQIPLKNRELSQKEEGDSITFINCLFRIEGSDNFSFKQDKSILKNSRVINSKIILSPYIFDDSKRNLQLKTNYYNVNSSEYSKLVVKKSSIQKGDGINSNCRVTVFAKNLYDVNAYYKKEVQDLVLNDSEIIEIQARQYGGCELDFYLELNGKIYFNSVKISNMHASVIIRIFKSFFYVEANKLNGIEVEVYPRCDTYDVVKSIPEYTHLPTVYSLGGNLYVDENDTAKIDGFIRVNKASVNKASGYGIGISPTNTQYANVSQLSTLYYMEKMKQENVYDDYISYMDEKTLYDKEQKEIEKQKMLSYQESLKENPDLTYEEFMSVQPTNLNLVEEPQPSQALQQFMEKYL